MDPWMPRIVLCGWSKGSSSWSISGDAPGICRIPYTAVGLTRWVKVRRKMTISPIKLQTIVMAHDHLWNMKWWNVCIILVKTQWIFRNSLQPETSSKLAIFYWKNCQVWPPFNPCRGTIDNGIWGPVAMCSSTSNPYKSTSISNAPAIQLPISLSLSHLRTAPSMTATGICPLGCKAKKSGGFSP